MQNLTTSRENSEGQDGYLPVGTIIKFKSFASSSDYSSYSSTKYVIKIAVTNKRKQIGTSYKVTGEIPAFYDSKLTTKDLDIFLKLPWPVEGASLDSLRKKFHTEMVHGKQLNDLNKIISEGTKSTVPTKSNITTIRYEFANFCKRLQDKNVTSVLPELQYIFDSLCEEMKVQNAHSMDFKLPKLIQAGIIEEISLPKSSKNDKREKEHYTKIAKRLNGHPVLLYEWMKGERLDEYILTTKENEKISENWKDIAGQWFSFAKGLASVVRRLHNHGFLHGHIVPRNIIVDKNKKNEYSISLAGFGYSSLAISGTSSIQPSKRRDPYEAPEARGGQSPDALWYLADIYSIGAILLFLATGKEPDYQRYIEDENKNHPDKKTMNNIETLKHYVRKELRDAMDDENKKIVPISGREHNVAKIIDNCLRQDPDDRIETIEDLLDAIDVAETETDPQSATNDHTPITLGSFFVALRKKKTREYAYTMDSINNRHHYEIYGSRTALIVGLCRILAGLTSGAVYKTITLPSYWTQNNLGPDGRFLAMNKHVAKKGVIIKRIFLVTGPYHTLSNEEQKILNSQRDAVQEIKSLAEKSTEIKPIEVRINISVPEKIDEVIYFEKLGKSVAFIEYPPNGENKPSAKEEFVRNKMFGKYLCLNFISRGSVQNHYGKSIIKRQILKTRVWDPGRGEAYWAKLKDEIVKFNDHWTSGHTMDIEDYISADSGYSLQELLKYGDQQKEAFDDLERH